MPHEWTAINKIRTSGDTWENLWRCGNCLSQWVQKEDPGRDFRMSFRDVKNVSCEEIQDIMAVRSVHES